MNIAKNIFYKATIIVVLLFTAVSCVKEHLTDIKPDNSVQVTFAVKVPGQNLPVTKAMSLDDENSVRRVDVLAFEVTGTAPNYTETFAYHAQASKIDTDAGDVTEKVFKVKLIKGGEKKYRYVLLANLEDGVGNSLAASSEGKTKPEILENLMFSIGGAWKANLEGATAFDLIPMWGETPEPMVLTDNTVDDIAKVKLIRMAARIDVSVAATAQGVFKLHTIDLYNRNTRGFVAPLAANWNSTSGRVTDPSVPTDIDPVGNPLTVTGPLQYTVADPHKSLVRSIYTFEATKGASSTLSTAPCVVIGGKYGTDDTMYYYRVDFVESDGTTFMDIKRNHCYRIDIVDVKGEGYSSSAIAFGRKAMNMKSEILVWDYSEIGNIIYNEDYAIGFSQMEFAFSRESRLDPINDTDNELVIYTDAPLGWKVDKIVDTDGENVTWFELSEMSGPSKQKTRISLNVQRNNDGAERVGYIHFSADRIKYVMKVAQSHTSTVKLDILDLSGEGIHELIFPNREDITPAEIPAQSYKVVWKPYAVAAENTSFFESFAVGTLPVFQYGSGTSIPTSGNISSPVGEISILNIKPDPFDPAEIKPGTGNPFLEKASEIEYVVSNSLQTIAKNIIIRQINYAAVPSTKPGYALNGLSDVLNIKCNGAWRLVKIEDQHNVITDFSPKKGGYNHITGQNVTINLIDDMATKSVFYTEVKFRIESTDPSRAFKPVEFTVPCASGVVRESSNCYIVEPSSHMIFIPVSRANEAVNFNWVSTDPAYPVQISETDVIEPVFLWTDNPTGVAQSNSTIKSYRIFGTGSKGYLVIDPGNVPGNAVIGVKVNGKIKWSWHIWVTGEPVAQGTNNVWMDRNLGALNAIEGSIGALGLYYQWGRKDPFPGAGALTGTTQMNIYDENGNPLPYGAAGGMNFVQITDDHNLINSIENPKNYYYNSITTDAKDWYMRGYNLQNNELWGMSGAKSVFDPCPDGWRVPIPDGLSYAESIYYWGNEVAPLGVSYNPSDATKPRWMPNPVYGARWAPKGGFYPAAGSYKGASSITQLGTQGYYASASTSTIYSVGLYFNSSRLYPHFSSTSYRHNTYSVRCVKEVGR